MHMQGCMHVLAHVSISIYEREVPDACLRVWAHNFFVGEDICNFEFVDTNLQFFMPMFSNRELMNYEEENCD